jgi:branched-chain amino acid transport system ATP-binding protein
MIGGQLCPTRGRISLFGRDVTGLTPHQRAHAGLSRTFQITSLFSNLTVEENLHLAVQAVLANRYSFWPGAQTAKAVDERTATIMSDWRFTGLRDTIVRDLSYGEQRKLEIAMALSHSPRLLLLDEPTSGLSAHETGSIVSLIKALGREVTILVIEHDMDVAFEIGDRFTIMNQGKVIADGDAASIRTNPEIQSIYFGDDEE